jgi:hypothetical protein|tara:strand:- start:143 stop:574 length:432 start_codon:yes stop_codon:yes gene_type:complete
MAKIVSITPTGQWQEFHKMDVAFDDGQKGTAFSKTPSPWYSIGDEVEYTLNAKGSVKISKGMDGFTGGGGSTYKPSGSSNNSNKDEQIARSVVFKGAIDLVSAGKITIQDIPRFVSDHVAIITGEASAGASYNQHFPPQESPF